LIGGTATSLSWARILGILKKKGKKNKKAGSSGSGPDHSERGVGIALQLVRFIFSFSLHFGSGGEDEETTDEVGNGF
jgi:hypothetical protein